MFCIRHKIEDIDLMFSILIESQRPKKAPATSFVGNIIAIDKTIYIIRVKKSIIYTDQINQYIVTLRHNIC